MSAVISSDAYNCQFNQGNTTTIPQTTVDGRDYNLTRCDGPTAETQGGITAAMPGGSWIGALVSGIISDRFGRKSSVQMGSLVWWVASIPSRRTSWLTAS